MNEDLTYILKEQHDLSVIGGIGALMGWDQMTYMPKAGSSDRAEQSAFLSKLSHDRVIADPFYDAVQRLQEKNIFTTLEEPQQHIITRLHKDLKKARKVPSTFVEKMAKTTTLSYQAWEQARSANKFSVFAPHLEAIFDLEREYISFFDIPGPAYNTLLDDYEEGMTVDILNKEFTTLRKELTSLLDTITTSKHYERQQPLDLTMEETQQKNLCMKVIKTMMLPEERARLDVSTHPFTTSLGDNDVRITTNFSRPNPLFSLFSTIHEAGHALYELGVPKGCYKDTVISDAPSLGIHESQSRFWENMIARGMPFWQYFYPELQQIHAQLQKMPLEVWYQHINQVKPSLIRVEADELTYCLHVILRFELEQQLINQEIKIGQLPDQWNQMMDEYLGITPDSDINGVLQDMHWSGGSVGYFPTYAIGSIYAAQLYQQLSKEHIDLSTHIQQGNFEQIIDWLKNHIHEHGRLFTADELIKNTCGEGLNAHVFLNYLKHKYLPIYEV